MSKVGQNSTAFKKDDLDQIRDVCSFEDIAQSRFHAKLSKCT